MSKESLSDHYHIKPMLKKNNEVYHLFSVMGQMPKANTDFQVKELRKQGFKVLKVPYKGYRSEDFGYSIGKGIAFYVSPEYEW